MYSKTSKHRLLNRVVLDMRFMYAIYYDLLQPQNDDLKLKLQEMT